MGPQSEGGPSGGGQSFGSQSYSDDRGRYQSDRELNLQDEQMSRPSGAFTTSNMAAASPTNSLPGRERELDTPKSSGERTRSRTRSGKTGSGQLRLCQKCGDPLTGQFVRALGGTFHLDCFRCRVCEHRCICDPHH
jgi:hypothetical protein